MNLHFLPSNLRQALDNLNCNFISEIRLRRGQAVIIEYKGEYKYINQTGIVGRKEDALVVYDVEKILSDAMCASVYAYSEQLKGGFITVDGGIRIGVAGEYVCDSGKVSTIHSVTSLNIRIPHDVTNCSKEIYNTLLNKEVCDVLIFSPPGYGKTTILRDLTKQICKNYSYNILLFDERNEIAAYDNGVFAYDLGEKVDVIRSGDKIVAFENAIRAMKPQVIITDELYGENDFSAVSFAINCGIKVIASSHITKVESLKKLPFSYYVQLTGISQRPNIYDKNFNSLNDNNIDDVARVHSFTRKEEENDRVRRTV
jgi:stage III sporulation protein AA